MSYASCNEFCICALAFYFVTGANYLSSASCLLSPHRSTRELRVCWASSGRSRGSSSSSSRVAVAVAAAAVAVVVTAAVAIAGAGAVVMVVVVVAAAAVAVVVVLVVAVAVAVVVSSSSSSSRGGSSHARPQAPGVNLCFSAFLGVLLACPGVGGGGANNDMVEQ